ncbi:potassium voltage-gated channel protein Shaw-like [Ostrea edulis]|uniref:potassium voltage-gated channel protein Shaw-like n=1 Tax=Ostrea edulis TaxID=37623 RepID=UPI0024AEC470|nr:potassium voltage-gated channel protein Shaw-like [Ostrea edulis]
MDEDGSQRILPTTINVGGTTFQTTMATLKKIPLTRLSRLCPSSPEYNQEYGEYFFDHNPTLFQEILDLYRSGELHIPSNICGAVFKREMEYWEIPKHLVSECCFHSFHRYISDMSTITSIQDSLADVLDYDPDDTKNSCWLRLKRRIWIFLDQPKSSKCAQVWTCIIEQVKNFFKQNKLSKLPVDGCNYLR